MVTTMTDDLLISMLGSPAAAGLARSLADPRLRKWDCFRIFDDVLLVVTELVTNAAQETPGREIRFQLSRDVHGLIVAVWDGSPRLPTPRPLVVPDLDGLGDPGELDLDLSEDRFDGGGGRGLAIVQALSATCGCTRDPAGGKWTWARLIP